jgi:hypothetical protein
MSVSAKFWATAEFKLSHNAPTDTPTFGKAEPS